MGSLQAAHLYVHLPFCAVICHYCDFYTARLKEADHERLFGALQKHLTLEQHHLKAPLRSIYFGGGTPSASPPALLRTFLDPLRPLIHETTEISLEANPNDLSLQNLEAWRAAGFNRLSIGVQSLSPFLLQKLGRTHSAEDALDGIARARSIFPIVSADLIYAVPEQAVDDPARDARRLMEAGVKHLSAYHLTLEPEHFLHKKLPGDTHAFEQVSRLHDELGGLGFEQYEVSNFAPPGLESVHNRAYWSGRAYLALGPSGHGFDGASRRWKNISDWRAYAARVEEGASPTDFEEILSPDQRYLELLFTGLRTREGLDLQELKERTGRDLRDLYGRALGELMLNGLAYLEGTRLRLSFQGRMLADKIVEKLS